MVRILWLTETRLRKDREAKGGDEPESWCGAVTACDHWGFLRIKKVKLHAVVRTWIASETETRNHELQACSVVCPCLKTFVPED